MIFVKTQIECFTQLKRNDSANKAMLDSWLLSERTYETKKSFYSHGTAFDAVGSMTTDGQPYNPSSDNLSREQYQEYAWLFGKKIKVYVSFFLEQ